MPRRIVRRPTSVGTLPSRRSRNTVGTAADREKAHPQPFYVCEVSELRAASRKGDSGACFAIADAPSPPFCAQLVQFILRRTAGRGKI